MITTLRCLVIHRRTSEKRFKTSLRQKKMKFRLRGQIFKVPKIVEFEGSNVSVIELKSRLAEILGIQLEDVKDIKLSMNGKQIIESQDDNLLTSLGFVSGDSIYIMGTLQSDEPATKTVKCDQPCTSDSVMDSEKREQSEADTEANFLKEDHYTPVCDTPTGVIPQALEDLAKKSKIVFSSPLEEIAALLHILMIETGFLPTTENYEENAYITLPHSWKNAVGGTLRLHYKTALSPNSPCEMIVSSMNRLIIVHGAASSVSRSMKLKPADYLPLVGGNRLRQLSLSFKNEISFPLLVGMQREVEGVCPANLSNLPAEMLYSILGRLDAKSLCRLSAGSRFFREICNRPEVWKKLVLRDFEKKHAGKRLSALTNWKRIYQDEFEVARPRNVPRTFCQPPLWNPFLEGPFTHPPNGPRVRIPGIIGGEEDGTPSFGPYAPPLRRDPFHGSGRPDLEPFAPLPSRDPTRPFRPGPPPPGNPFGRIPRMAWF